MTCSIDMHLSSLRKKLGPLSEREKIRIKTVRGVGYPIHPRLSTLGDAHLRSGKSFFPSG